jgi:toxin ParE1/3/4
MAKYKLTNKAVQDLAKIWDYTFEKWSEKQADTYYKTLILYCGEIAENPSIGKTYDRITENLLGIKANKHIIFYREIERDYVEIIRVLHERMDLKNRILE